MISVATKAQHEPDETLQTGKVLDGKYRVDHLVGQGGMAAVWAGTNVRTGKHVALKVLLPSVMGTPGVDSLFQKEGLAASRVDHPNVVTVFDVIEHQGMACIVMELLTGEPLSSYLARNGALSVMDAYGLLLPAMRGVSAAHAQGVIHRDLKPQNIFVCIGPDGRTVTTKVLDFGISLIVERARDPLTAQAPGVPMGTPVYMAPEQLSGSAQIDERADVYGFGVLFYETLTGKVPFPGEPGAELYERILTEPAPPLALFRSDLPPGLAKIIETALAKEPASRHANLDLMISALEYEILPATPLPRALASSTEASSLAGPLLATPVEAVARREPSGEHQATKFLSSFPLDAAAALRRVSAVEEDRNALARHRQDLPPEENRLEAVRREALSGIARPVPSRAWRGLAGVGIVGLVAGSAFVLWMLGGNGIRDRVNLPALVVRARPRVSAPPTPLLVPVATPVAPTSFTHVDEPTDPPPDVEAKNTTMHSKPSARTRTTARPGLRGSRLAMNATAKAALVRRQSPGGAASIAPPSLQSGLPAPPPKPRAGVLSTEDF